MKQFMLLLMAITCLNTFAGNEGGHGGDSYAQEFVTLGHTIQRRLNKTDLSDLVKSNGIDLNLMKTTLDKTLVYSAENEEVTLNGKEVSAINFPDKGMILINRTKWREASVAAKLKLVMHEYFGLMNVERDTYQVSNKFEAVLNILAKDVINLNPQGLRFFALKKVSKALYETKDACDSGLDSVAKALEETKKIATTKCEAELRTRCQLSSQNLKKVLSSIVPGLSYCEVTAEALVE